MKYISKLFLALVLIIAFGACKKVAELPFYPNGAAVVLSSSVNTVSTAPADSGKKCASIIMDRSKICPIVFEL